MSIRDGPKQFQVESTVPHGVIQLSSPETIPQLSRCAGSCLRCLVLVVLLGPPLIYHDGSRLAPEEAVGRCGCVSTSPES